MKETPLLRTLVLVISALAACFAASLPRSPSSPRQGFSSEELLQFAQSLPPLPVRIQTIQFLRGSEGNFPGFAGLLTQSVESGWQVFVFRFEPASHFPLEWKSGKLDDSFAVSSPEAFKRVDLGGESVITFEGCAAHACPDVFSALLYAPSSHREFTTTYLQGKITRSPGLDPPGSSIYGKILADVLERRRAISRAVGGVSDLRGAAEKEEEETEERTRASLAQNSEQYRNCSEKARTQAQMDACANEEAARVDGELNRFYTKLLSTVEGDPAGVAKIRAAQGAWIAYRDAYIDAMYPARDKRAEYGSAYPMEVDLLRAKLTRQQITALKALLQQYTG